MRREVPQGRGRLIRARSSFAASLLAAILAAAIVLPACKKSESKPAVEQPTIRKDRYTVRGQVAMLPSADNPSSEFMVRHEAIPHFVGEGAELGMDTMTMPFPLAEGLAINAFKVGDKVELTFEVDFDTQSKKMLAYRAVGVTSIAPGTELDFSSIKK